MDCHIIMYPSPEYLASYVEGYRKDGYPDSQEATDEEISMDALHEFLYKIHFNFKDLSCDSKWVTGFELGSKNQKWHYHATLYNSPYTKENLRAKLNKEFRCPKKGLAIKDIKNPETVCSYTIKGGLYCSFGFDQEEIDEFLKNSYEKQVEKLDFKKLLKKIEQDYLEDKGTFQEEEFVERYIQAYLDYGKPIYLSHIKARLITVRLRKSPERLKNYVRDVLMEIGTSEYYRK